MMGPTVDSDLSLLHDLEERRLRARRRAVDLVGKDEVGEHRAGMEDESVLVLVEDRDAGHIARQQVGSELDALPRRPERAGEAARNRGLAHAGNVLEQQMPLG